MYYLFFFFNDTATTEIYTLSLHDALPIYIKTDDGVQDQGNNDAREGGPDHVADVWKQIGAGDGGCQIRGFRQRRHLVTEIGAGRSEEHTSELQSRTNLVCRLLLEKKKQKNNKKK